MASYFFDTSAIIKRYVPEHGQTLILSLCNPTQGNKLYISQTTLVEIVAGMCRKTREQAITLTERDNLIRIFRRDAQKAYGIQRVTTAIYTEAGNLCRIHALRAYDAVQLASALNLRNKALIGKVSSPIFVCADNNLIHIAEAEGLRVINPNTYQ